MAPVTPSEQNKKEMSTSHWAYAYCPKAPWDNRRARMATTANLDPVRTMPAAADQAECRRIDMRPRACKSLSRSGPPSTSVGFVKPREQRYGIEHPSPENKDVVAFKKPVHLKMPSLEEQQLAARQLAHPVWHTVNHVEHGT